MPSLPLSALPLYCMHAAEGMMPSLPLSALPLYCMHAAEGMMPSLPLSALSLRLRPHREELAQKLAA